MPPSPASLRQAILQTIAYADIFDYPLTAAEIHRYLIRVPAALDTVVDALSNGLLAPDEMARRGEYFTLPGREGLVETREQRARLSARLWPLAVRYGRAIAGLPFVRMVALTGALAVDNSRTDDDLDYLIVTESGRLWTCRAWVILLVHLVARSGVVICPNYFLSENALALDDRSLFTARELAQMVPLSGLSVYHHMRQVNAWADALLPNAHGPPRPDVPATRPRAPLRPLAETLLRTPPGDWLERWEMSRKITKFTRLHPHTNETHFSPDRCQGHFDGYRAKTLAAFDERVKLVGTRGDS